MARTPDLDREQSVSTLRRHSRVSFLGYQVDSLSLEDGVGWVTQALQMPKFHHICVLNANKMWIADRDIELRRILCGSELVIPEYAIVWGCRVLGTPLRSHVGGIMLLKALLPWLESNAISVYFLGARPDVVELMQARLRLRYPGLKVAGAHSGYFNAEDSPQILKDINDSGARMLFVAMGSPRQERWIESHREHLRVQVAMGVGGSFDVLAGVKKDAAPWMRHGGEWLYRLLQDPRNLWKRYLTTNPWFVARVLREKFLPCKVSTPTGTL